MIKFYRKMERSCWKMSSLLCIFLSFQIGALSQTVNIETDKQLPIERADNITIICSMSGDPTLLIFHLIDIDQALLSYAFEDKKCVFLPARNISMVELSWECDYSSKTVRVTIHDVPEILHNAPVQCQVSFPGINNIFKSLNLKINVPLIDTEMSLTQNLTMEENEERNISCTARSRPLPTFRWFISGEEILDNQTIQTEDINRTSTILYTGNRTHNNGRLYCVATRPTDTIGTESIDVFLNIIYQPDIAVIPEGLPIETVSSYNISCTVLDSNPFPSSFNWSVGGNVKPEFKSSLLTIDILNRTDSNDYTCWVSNDVGNITMDTVYLDVLYKGTILNLSLSNSSLMEGSAFTASVDVEGKPLPNITWYYERTNAVLRAESGVQSSSVNVSMYCEDTGNYSLKVDNGLLEADKRTFRVEVPCVPRIDLGSGISNNVNIKGGQLLTLEASFIAFPTPYIKWYFRANNSKENTTITQNENLAISHTSIEAVHMSSMSIKQANSSHTGHYFVVVENEMGKDARLFTVVITDTTTKNGVAVEAIVAGVLCAVVFIIMAGCVVNCYRKKKRKEKRREVAWMTNNKDIDDIIKENPIEDVEHIDPTYVSNPTFYRSKPSTEKTALSEKKSTEDTSITTETSNNIYAKVEKQKQSVQFSSVVVSDQDANTKL